MSIYMISSNTTEFTTVLLIWAMVVTPCGLDVLVVSSFQPPFLLLLWQVQVMWVVSMLSVVVVAGMGDARAVVCGDRLG